MLDGSNVQPRPLNKHIQFNVCCTAAPNDENERSLAARDTSSHGDSSCASCYIFGDFDGLAWTIGDPDGDPLDNLGPFAFELPGFDSRFHPMKGPMSTQRLRGLANHGPMHWRGDRTGSNDLDPSTGELVASAQPDSGAFDEDAAFRKFNGAFVDLLRRSEPLTPEEMQAFTDFILQVTYPPNPIRNLDNSLTSDQQSGRHIFMTNALRVGVFQCVSCHVFDPHANSEYGVAAPGFFGTDGKNVTGLSGINLPVKVPHLRNMYQKVGMFGDAEDPALFTSGSADFTGDQVRGFGFLHDGSIDMLDRFFTHPGFAQNETNPEGFPVGPAGDAMRRQVASFMFVFDSNMAPIVGQQITLTSTNAAVVAA